MRFRIKPKQDKPIIYWRTWFAWYPVHVEMADGSNMLVWLEYVECRNVSEYAGSSSWRYREIIK